MLDVSNEITSDCAGHSGGPGIRVLKAKYDNLTITMEEHAKVLKTIADILEEGDSMAHPIQGISQKGAEKLIHMYAMGFDTKTPLDEDIKREDIFAGHSKWCSQGIMVSPMDGMVYKGHGWGWYSIRKHDGDRMGRHTGKNSNALE